MKISMHVHVLIMIYFAMPNKVRNFLETKWIISCRKAYSCQNQPNFAKREEVNGDDGSRIRWRRIGLLNVNEAIKIKSLVPTPEAPKHFKLAMASRRAVLSGNTGNTSLICHISSLICCTHQCYRRQ